MKRKIIIPMKPFSINKFYYRDRSIVTTDARNWISELIWHLQQEPNKTNIAELREAFDPELHAYHIEIILTYPANILLNKANMLSAKAFDISNCEKPIVDVIFLPKFEEGCNLGVDDRYLNSMTSRRRVGEKHSIEIELEIVDLIDSVHR